jgi:hypothetical protein
MLKKMDQDVGPSPLNFGGCSFSSCCSVTSNGTICGSTENTCIISSCCSIRGLNRSILSYVVIVVVVVVVIVVVVVVVIVVVVVVIVVVVVVGCTM